MNTGIVEQPMPGNASADNADKLSGKVKWFNNAKGYGFIVADNSSEDMFAHYSSIAMEGYKTLKAGQSVFFNTKQSENGTHAIDITTADTPSKT